MLEITGLAASLEAGEGVGKAILNGVDLVVPTGEVHAIMGPNGSGKSTLSYVLSGREGYEVTAGSATFDGLDLLDMEPEARAAAGLFLAFQYPVELPGVGNANFLRTAYNAQARAKGEKELDAVQFLARRAGGDEAAGDAGRHAEAQRERGVQRRREEAQRSASDGGIAAEAGHPRRDG